MLAWLTDTLQLYARVGRKAGELLVRNPAVLLPSLLYCTLPLLAAILVIRFFTGPLSLVGGFLLLVIVYACCSAVLAFTVEVIRYGRVRPDEIGTAFGSFLSDVFNLGFALWGLNLIASIALGGPSSPFYWFAVVVALVLFNAVPEFIGLGRENAVQALGASWRFIGVNWIEWFPPSIAFVLLGGVVPPLVTGGNPLLSSVLTAPVLAYAMLFRGLLFEELHQSSRRARAFKRMAGE